MAKENDNPARPTHKDSLPSRKIQKIRKAKGGVPVGEVKGFVTTTAEGQQFIDAHALIELDTEHTTPDEKAFLARYNALMDGQDKR